MKKSIGRNIRLIYVISILNNALFTMPILVPFFYENGLNQTQVYLTQSVFALMVVLMEVPSGYFADVVGRKASILVGSLLYTAGFMSYGLADSLWPIILSEALLGLAVSFLSGADEALLYDTLASQGKETKYKNVVANQMGFAAGSTALAGIAGGALAVVSLRAPFIAQIAVTASVIPLALALKEPPRQQPMIDKNPFRGAWKIVSYTFSHQKIGAAILYTAVIGTATHTMVWLYPVFYGAVGLPVWSYGLLWAGILVTTVVMAKLTDRLETRFGINRMLKILVLAVIVSYLLTSQLIYLWSLPILLGFACVRGILKPLMSDYINRQVSSDIRATVISIASLAQRGLYVIAGPLVGLAVDKFSLSSALLLSGLVYGSLGLWIVHKIGRNGGRL